MRYDEVVSDVVKVVEAIGAGVMIVGAVVAATMSARQAMRRDPSAYRSLRENLGRVILLGLELLIIADIIRTIVVDQTLESVAVLGLIVVIRIVLSFSLEVEIEGAWPWQRRRASGA